MSTVFAAVLERMYRRVGVDGLGAHLEQSHGVHVAATTELDVGVFRVDRLDGDPLVARMFATARPHDAAIDDLAVLRHLAELGYPAERPFGDGLSRLEGQSVLVTHFVRAAPKGSAPPHPIVRLGARIAVLNGLDVPPAADRPSGALHHYTEGTPTQELTALREWLDCLRDRFPTPAAFEALQRAVADADGGDGLPEAFVHPDPVSGNAIFTADGPVLVDWAGAGRGPRLAAMTRPLRSSWAGVPFLRGWSRRASLTDQERDRLAGLLFSRGLSDLVFRACVTPAKTATAPRKIATLRRESDKQAARLLAAL